MYQAMVSKGLLKNLMRVRANTLCNSRHFPRGVTHCPVDGQVLSIHHAISHCAITTNWRRDTARLLQCEEQKILQTLENREVLKKNNICEHLSQLEAICKPLGSIQKQASKGDLEWRCPPIEAPQQPPRIQHKRRDREEEIAPIADHRAGASTGFVQFGPRPIPRQAQL